MFYKDYYVYILASKRNGTLYIGVTNDIIRRIQEHKEGLIDGFTKKYKVHILVYYETYADISDAIYREKQLKVWKRKYKLDLIEKSNPSWKDFYNELISN
jgi:putative endonuclease